MLELPELSPQGAFALVSYVPDPLGAFLDHLRHLLAGEADTKAHVTMLPPRPVNLPIEQTFDRARAVLTRFSAFSVELSEVRRFFETNVLYVDIGDGNAVLHDLHDALNSGDLFHQEKFEFRPHLTISGPLAPESIDGVQERAVSAWSVTKLPRRFEIDEVAFLWMNPQNPEWQLLWTCPLKREKAVGVTSRT